jgi:hypothetical protein
MNSIFPFFKWLNDTSLSKMINDSKWLFPAIEGVHIAALALLFGTILVVNLRLMGVIMRDRPLVRLSRELEPWTLCSLVVILITGVLLFVSEAIRSFHSGPFRIKIVLHQEERQLSPALRKFAGVIAIALWMGVGFAGRAIGFF